PITTAESESERNLVSAAGFYIQLPLDPDFAGIVVIRQVELHRAGALERPFIGTRDRPAYLSLPQFQIDTSRLPTLHPVLKGERILVFHCIDRNRSGV